MLEKRVILHQVTELTPLRPLPSDRLRLLLQPLYAVGFWPTLGNPA